jgi:glycosyltransferase involved in cell wall biosynthesis
MTQNTSYPLVSIALATYNGAKYLEQQLDSLYNQTYPNIEVVVTDDRSTDNTVAILERYQQQRGLRYTINENNLGYTGNFAMALSLCKGEYIACADQDDIWHANKVERMMEKIGSNSLLHSDAALIDENGQPLHPSNKRFFRVVQYANAAKADKHVFRISIVQGCTMLMTKELRDKALPIPQGEAYDTWLPIVACRLNGLTYLDEPLMDWRYHRKSTSQRNKLLHKAYMLFFSRLYRQYRLVKRHRHLAKRGL